MEKERKIICNKIRTPDGTILESKSVHDYVTHIDKNGLEYSTDGGHYYLHRIVHNDAPYEDLTIYDDDPFEIIRENLKWGTYGKSGKEELRWILLKEMSNDHINSILTYVKNINEMYKKFFKMELEYRKNNNIYLEDNN